MTWPEKSFSWFKHGVKILPLSSCMCYSITGQMCKTMKTMQLYSTSVVIAVWELESGKSTWENDSVVQYPDNKSVRFFFVLLKTKYQSQTSFRLLSCVIVFLENWGSKLDYISNEWLWNPKTLKNNRSSQSFWGFGWGVHRWCSGAAWCPEGTRG